MKRNLAGEIKKEVGLEMIADTTCQPWEQRGGKSLISIGVEYLYTVYKIITTTTDGSYRKL